MGFGVDAGISRNTNFSVSVAEKSDENGVIDALASYGGASETTEEVYVDAASFVNLATNEQGSAGTSIVTAHSLIESNTEYARASKTTRAALPATTTI
jgi:hypothetical protein